MNRINHISLAALIAASTITLPLRASDNALYLDGRFRAQGASLRDARVVVTRDAMTMQVLTDDLRHIRLRLDLQVRYVIRFEREGYRAKELLFDTRMDEEAMAQAPFTFRFDVTLEPEFAEDGVRYAGPVGYVRYAGSMSGFNYDLDYRLTHDAKGTDLNQDIASTVPAGAGTVSVSAARTRRERRYVQPFIDPTRDMERMAEARKEMTAAREAGNCANGACTVAGQAEGITVLNEEDMPVFDPNTMERSVIVEEERTITITRLKVDGHLVDYRRIVHANGAVLHYRNGSNCGYSDYAMAVGAD